MENFIISTRMEPWLLQVGGCMMIGSWYYAFASGELATGDVTIGSTIYHFDEMAKRSVVWL